MICFLLGHKFGRAFSRGKRTRVGRWISDAEPQYQICPECGAERDSPIQFGAAQDDAVVDKEARVASVRAV